MQAQDLLHGPRMIGARRQLSIPRRALVSAGIDVPGRVRFVVTEGVVCVRRAEEGEEGAQMVSKVGQLVTPPWVMQTLGVGVGGAIYALARNDSVVEVLAGSRLQFELEGAA
jgi:hypothetical protein